MKKLIVHVAEVDLSEESGMGRVGYQWKNEMEKRGYDFVHIGPAQVGSLPHHALFPYAAYQAYKRLGKKASLFLVHEPASGAFINRRIPTVLVSHGLERRAWELALKAKNGLAQPVKWRTKTFFPLWRLRLCDLGMIKSTKLLLINQEDRIYAQQKYSRDSRDIYIFNNGVYSSNINEEIQPKECSILFVGTWINRKGIKTIVEAAEHLHRQGIRLNWILAGTGCDRQTVLNSWLIDPQLVEVISHFSRYQEESILARSNIVILPSFFEGQPLSLLQAMEAGRCCITTNCCGQRDLIQHGYNGLLHEPGDSYKLATLIKQCVADDKLRKFLGKNAISCVKNRQWETVAAEVADQIEQLLF